MVCVSSIGAIHLPQSKIINRSPAFPGRGEGMKIKHNRSQDTQFVRFVAVDLDGNAFDVEKDDYTTCPIFSRNSVRYSLLRQFAANELGRSEDNGKAPKHIGYMQRHDLVDYCDVSEKGHFKWLPKGLLIQKLLLDYAENLAYVWGAFAMKNPVIIRGDHNVIGELMGEFHERDYQVDGGRGLCYLRYASDPLAFPFMQKIQFSHRQSPLKVYEEATCFRNEQQGEVSGLKRVRSFIMTDMHAACASEEEARIEFEQLCIRFADLMNTVIAKGRWVLGWEGTVEFYEQNRAWLIGIGKRIGVPAFFKLMPVMNHYYAMKNEFQAITEDNSNVQISTVQWDVKDGPRFDIGYVDDSGKKHPCPVIIHASSFGSIERTLCAILENIAIDAAEGKRPMFPDWLVPTQVRIIPVSKDHLDGAVEISERISRQRIRVDIDDRSETLGKRIRDAEKEWVPYIGVVGDREIASGQISVRVRRKGEVVDFSVDGLAEEIQNAIGDMPFRPLSLPMYMSRRPIFLR